MGRFNSVACGRRWGKTVLGFKRAALPCIAGWPVGWFAPEYKYLIEVWSEAKRRLAPIIARSNQSEGRIELTTGGVWEFWSLKDNPDAGRSRKYKHAVIDEAAKVKNLQKAYHEAIRPTLSDYQGSLDLYSTPKGMDFFASTFQWGQDGKNGWQSWRMPTATNPYIPADEIDAARAELPERVYQQEYEALFLENAGGVFRNVRECVDKGRTANEPCDATRTHTLGADLARVEDFTVLCVLDDAGKQVYFERFNQISWERQIERIKAVAAQYKAGIFIDTTGLGDPLTEQLRKSGLPVYGFVFTNSSKEQLIDRLAIKLENGELRLMDHEVQTTELLAYQYELTPSRNVKMGAPEGMHDDTVIALGLATWGLGRRRTLKINTYADTVEHDDD